MTEPTPRTKAGRDLVKRLANRTTLWPQDVVAVLAIEAEAHLLGEASMAQPMLDAFTAGAAQARTEAEHDIGRVQTLLEDMTQDYNALAQARTEALDVEALERAMQAHERKHGVIQPTCAKAVIEEYAAILAAEYARLTREEGT